MIGEQRVRDQRAETSQQLRRGSRRPNQTEPGFIAQAIGRRLVLDDGHQGRVRAWRAQRPQGAQQDCPHALVFVDLVERQRDRVWLGAQVSVLECIGDCPKGACPTGCDVSVFVLRDEKSFTPWSCLSSGVNPSAS